MCRENVKPTLAPAAGLEPAIRGGVMPLSAIGTEGRGEACCTDPLISTALPLRYTGVFSGLIIFLGRSFSKTPPLFLLPPCEMKSTRQQGLYKI